MGGPSAMSSVFFSVLRHNNGDPKQLTGTTCIDPSGSTLYTPKCGVWPFIAACSSSLVLAATDKTFLTPAYL